MPNQELYLGRIGTVELEIQILNQKLQQIQEELKQARKHLELLYARELALESVVREVFRHLGASVEEPQGENKEDGWITPRIEETTYEGVLEIKSTNLTHFKENGIRQLLEWI